MFRKKEVAASNAAFVSRIVRMAEEFERPVATVAEARKILGLV
jgi:3-keto-5-aminohexanoate cleavage enzyme